MGIPAELRSRFDGRWEIKYSPRTKDREEVKRLIPDHLKAGQRLFEQARHGIGTSIPARAAHLQDDDRKRLELSKIEADEIARLEGEREELEPDAWIGRTKDGMNTKALQSLSKKACRDRCERPPSQLLHDRRAGQRLRWRGLVDSLPEAQWCYALAGSTTPCTNKGSRPASDQ